MPLKPGVPSKSTRKNRPFQASPNPVPGYTQAPDGPCEKSAIGGTMYAAWPSKCGYQSLSSFHAPRSTGSVSHW